MAFFRECVSKHVCLWAERSIVISSDTELSKMTALLIAAGLWPPPPEQVWNDTLPWQPVPYTYPPRRQDFVSDTNQKNEVKWKITNFFFF